MRFARVGANAIIVALGLPEIGLRIADHEPAEFVVRQMLVVPATSTLELFGSISNGDTNPATLEFPASVKPLTAELKVWPPSVLFMKFRFCHSAYWIDVLLGLMAQNPPSPVNGTHQP